MTDKCQLCGVELGVPIRDGRGFLPVYIDTAIGGRVDRSGPYCQPCQTNMLRGLSLWADGKWRERGAEQKIVAGKKVPGEAFPE